MRFDRNRAEAKRLGHVLNPDQKHRLADAPEADQYRTLCRALGGDALESNVGIADDLSASGEFRRRLAADTAEASLLRLALARTSLKDAVGEVAVATGLPRRALYQRALELTKLESRETKDGAPR